MINEKIEIWKKEEYHYPAAHGFIPVMFSYIHEDEKKHPAMIIAPGGAYREVSPSEAHLPAMEFYGAGYNVFVLEYTINQLDEAPLKMQPLHDISRTIRMIRSRAEEFHIRPDRIAVCGFSAGAHLCGSLCVHNKDVEDPEEAYQNISNRPDVAILSYPVITSGKYAHRDSFVALFGKEPSEQELDYMSLENHVTKDTPPCFLWQTVTDQTVPVENSYLFAQACAQAGVHLHSSIFRRNPWTICGNRRVVRAEYRTGRRKKIYTGTGADACRGNRGRRDSISKGKRRGTSGEVRYRT